VTGIQFLAEWGLRSSILIATGALGPAGCVDGVAGWIAGNSGGDLDSAGRAGNGVAYPGGGAICAGRELA